MLFRSVQILSILLGILGTIFNSIWHLKRTRSKRNFIYIIINLHLGVCDLVLLRALIFYKKKNPPKLNLLYRFQSIKDLIEPIEWGNCIGCLNGSNVNVRYVVIFSSWPILKCKNQMFEGHFTDLLWPLQLSNTILLFLI